MSTSNPAQQEPLSVALCTSVTTTTPSTGQHVEGYNGAQMVDVVAVGTVAAQAVTFQIEGSIDGTNFYTVGSQRVDAQASPARSVTATTLTPGNGTARQVLQVLDAYRYLRINPSANTLSGTGAGLTATLYAVPV